MPQDLSKKLDDSVDLSEILLLIELSCCGNAASGADELNVDKTTGAQSHRHLCTAHARSSLCTSYAGTKMLAGVALQDSMRKGDWRVISTGFFQLGSPFSNFERLNTICTKWKLVSFSRLLTLHY